MNQGTGTKPLKQSLISSLLYPARKKTKTKTVTLRNVLHDAGEHTDFLKSWPLNRHFFIFYGKK